MIFTRIFMLGVLAVTALTGCATKSHQQASGVGIVMNGIQNNPDRNCDTLEQEREKHKAKSEQ